MSKSTQMELPIACILLDVSLESSFVYNGSLDIVRHMHAHTGRQTEKHPNRKQTFGCHTHAQNP